ncbi:methyltransferase domain-containing protein [Rhodopirellula sp. MGV]|uniref:methyltransferase domain-containing protein n=1 Tax=Rhodopirellula sp. MGV TaxID=2023130 RepID=UPI000B97A540|nr:methyltransferase domain-containing protein [Rhodopirellula sp. MGV]OYP33941.1 hypothetical protein CGZ80_17330 [Rhodopirellula sp. MGV]PNY34078.1 methyltransferase domain-containing protein [Rhodopirellula baltica]
MLVDQRILEPELMDDPALARSEHDAALRGLKRINRFSGSSRFLWSAIEAQIQAIDASTIRILDVASGGGDTVIALSKKAAKHHRDFQIDGCDISPQAVAHASEFAKTSSPLQNNFFIRDVLERGLPDGYHVIMCSLFLHHLSDSEAVQLIKTMAERCEHCLLIDDLRRTDFGLVLAWAGVRLLSRSPIVHFDGPQSVKAAFSDQETLRLAERAGLSGVNLRRHWPQRFLLSWCKR